MTNKYKINSEAKIVEELEQRKKKAKAMIRKDLKDKDSEWILRKHLSTRERLPYYEKIYKRILKDLDKEISIIDLGAGINGFSYDFFPIKINYVAIEAIGQLVKLMNNYFRKEKISGKAIHLSLFELGKVKKIIKAEKRPSIVFLFKTIDSLEMLKRDYSKELISEIVGFVDMIVVSFATKSMGSGIRFRANRKWIVDFIQDNFKVIDDFELGGERYISFSENSK